MKKVILLVTLLGGISFSSMASTVISKNQGKLTVQVTKKNNIRIASKSKKVEDCGWVNISVTCGETFLGHVYCCNALQAYERLLDMQDEYCGN